MNDLDTLATVMCRHLVIVMLAFQPCLGALAARTFDSTMHSADDPCGTQCVCAKECLCAMETIPEDPGRIPPQVPDTRDSSRLASFLFCAIPFSALYVPTTRLPDDNAAGNEPPPHPIRSFFCIWLK